MYKKLLLSAVVLVTIVFSFNVCFANNGLKDAADGVRNVVGDAENAVEGAAKDISNASKNATGDIEKGANNVGNDMKNTANSTMDNAKKILLELQTMTIWQQEHQLLLLQKILLWA